MNHLAVVIGVLSGKGGVGKTTVVANLGTVLTNVFQKRVLIIDGNVTTSHLGMHFGLYEDLPVTLKDVLSKKAPVSHGIFIHPVFGVRILPSPISGDGVNLSKLKNAVEKLKKMYEIILIDCAPGLGKEAVFAIQSIDKALIVTTPDLPAITDAMKTIQLLEKMKKEPMGIIVNRYKKQKHELTLQEISSTCNSNIIGFIPEDVKIQEAIAKGLRVMMYSPNANSSRHFKQVAAKIIGAYYEEESMIDRLKSTFGFGKRKVEILPAQPEPVSRPELPKMEKNDSVNVKKITMLDKETQPPKRYTEASIIKELEKRNLGTKATRSEIVDTLFQRGYVDGKQIEATELGIKTIETLEKYVPKIVDDELTKHFEDETEKIMEGKQKEETVLEEAKQAITKIAGDLKKHEKEIGKELAAANRETRDEMTNLGECPICREGMISLRKGKYGRFAACNKYPDCKTTFSLPGNALIKPAKKLCGVCSYPMVLAIKKGKQPMEFCINKECKSKYLEGEAGKEAKEIAKGIIEKKCPKCEDGLLVLRTSIYGKFLGCRNYPKCRHIEKLTEEMPLKEDFKK